jgi:hypothetical protein
MIDVLKKYVSDYGMLATINDKIRGYISGLEMGMGAFKRGIGFVETVDNVEYLKWLKSLLIKMKAATLSFELCINWNWIPDPEDSPESIRTIGTAKVERRGAVPRYGYNGEHSPEETMNVVQHDDGTISVNNKPSTQIEGTEKTGTMRGRVASSTIKAIGRMYGFPEEVMDQAYSSYTDGDLGSVLNTEGRSSNENFPCPGIPGDDAYLRYVRSRIRQNRFRNT